MAPGTLAPEEVLAIHERVARDFAETDDPVGASGARENGHLLYSAVARQHVGFGDTLKYSDPYSNAATLTFGLCCGHPFYNGNKRTALVAMLAHLDRNGLSLFGVRQKELYSMIKAVATHELGVRHDPRKRKRQVYTRREADEEVAAIAKWLERRARRVQRGERQITYRQLHQVLNRFGYSLEHQKGPNVGIYREETVRRGVLRKKRPVKKRVGSIGYPGGGKVVSMKTIKQVRRICKLDEAHGCDTTSFYEGTDIIEVFVNEYRGILSKLARE